MFCVVTEYSVVLYCSHTKTWLQYQSIKPMSVFKGQSSLWKATVGVQMWACDEMMVASLEFLTLELQHMTHHSVEMHEDNVACKLTKMVEVKAEDVFSLENSAQNTLNGCF